MPARFTAKLLLLLYLSAACRSALPILADGLAHLLWYEHHYATVHAHDGHLHVHAEILAAAADETDGHQHAPTPIKSFKISDLLEAHFVRGALGFDVAVPFESARSAVFFQPFRESTTFLDVPTPPPDAAQRSFSTFQIQSTTMACGALRTAGLGVFYFFWK
jgi:hypothetical protein